MSNSYIGPIGETLIGTLTPNKCLPGSNVNEEVRPIPQNSRSVAWSSIGLVLHSGHILEDVILLCRNALDIFYSGNGWFV